MTGRRNLPNYERARLALQLKPLLAEEAKKRQGERNDLKDVSLESAGSESEDNFLQKSVKSPINVQKELAKAAGVSHDTIHKVEVIEEKAAPIQERLV